MTVTVTTRAECRICGSRDLARFFHNPAAPLTDDLVPVERAGSEFVAPLSVYLCEACSTAQTLHDVDVSGYYREYGYTVSSSPFAMRFMDELAGAVWGRFGFGPGDRVIEVGSGDGMQLAAFAARGARVLGFEPSDPLTAASQAAGVPVVQELFEPATVDAIPAELRPAQVVLLTYTFDHLPDPLGFLDAVRAAIDPRRGVLVIEVHDLERILARRETCLFEHEHSIYLTERTMQRLLARAGFELVSLDLVPEARRRGNSLLVAAALQGSEHAAHSVAPSSDPALDRPEAYVGFEHAVRESHERLAAQVRRVDGRVAGYGAGGRGVMTLAQASLGPADLAYVCDRNPALHGLVTPVSRVPVSPPERLRADPVDELVVFSFAYMDEIRRALGPSRPRLVSMLDLLAEPVARTA